MENMRKVKGMSIAKEHKIKQVAGGWIVPSQNSNQTYFVNEHDFECDCPDCKNTKKLFLIETNFYNGGGSKLKSVCGEFKSLFNELKAQKIELIWITDGKGWLTTTRPLEETFNNNNYVFNLNQLEKGCLQELLNY